MRTVFDSLLLVMATYRSNPHASIGGNLRDNEGAIPSREITLLGLRVPGNQLDTTGALLVLPKRVQSTSIGREANSRLGLAQLDGQALNDDPIWIRAITGLASGAETVGACKPVSVTLALGHLVGYPVPKASLRRDSAFGNGRRIGTGRARNHPNHDAS